MTDNINYRRVRQFVEDNLSKRKQTTQFVFFLVSLLMFTMFNIVAWGALGLGRYGGQIAGAGAMLTTGWGVSLLYHLIMLVLNTKTGEKQLRQSLTLQGIQREMARLGLPDFDEIADEKPKRHAPVQLSDDGELVDEAVAAPPASIQATKAQ